MRKNILVTGGSGRLGQLVCPFLKEKGYNVTNFDKAPFPAGTPAADAKIPYLMGDFCNMGECLRVILSAQPDVIVHLGAIPFNTELLPPYAKEYNPELYTGVRNAQRFPEETAMNVNTMGTFMVFDAARRVGVKNIVFASSYFTLGIGFRMSGTSYVPEYLPMDEDHPSLPEDTYSLSKYLNEETAKAFARAYDMRFIGLRFLGVYFDHIEANRKNANFGITVPAATNADQGALTGNTYQYVDSRDIANIIELSINKIGDPAFLPFEAFFVATDTTYLEDTQEVIKKRWPSLVEKGKGIQGTDGLISIEKAQRLLGYKPQWSWRGKK
jgi:nucleoside-diphosphate-sugar epimerase